MDTPLISLSKAGVFYKDRWLVKDIDLDLYRGEIITLIGHNGSGKTTTAKMALKIIRPTHGTVISQSNLKIGYVPQKIALNNTIPITVKRFMSLTETPSNKDVDKCLSDAQILHLKNQQLINLSGGELQRLLLARAIVKKPDILVLDEPLQGVDYSGEKQLYDWIKKIRDELNCGILLISHDLHIVMAATDKVLCLDGKLCCSGTPEIIQQTETYQNFLKGHSLAIYQHNHDKQ